eukprot:scaffold18777_cov123-Isochrysis_galbana.AAC.2
MAATHVRNAGHMSGTQSLLPGLPFHIIHSLGSLAASLSAIDPPEPSEAVLDRASYQETSGWDISLESARLYERFSS